MKIDLLLKNANVITLEDSLPNAEWLGISKDKIACVGTGEHPEALVVEDMEGATLLPGFCDSHIHPTATALSFSNVDLSMAGSISEVLEILEKACNEKESGDLVAASNFSESNLKEKRYPTIEELDSISMDKKLMVEHQTLHGCVLNTAAFITSGLDKDFMGVELTDGEPNGNVTDDIAYGIALEKLYAILSDDELKKTAKICSDHAKSLGITTLHALSGNDGSYGDMPRLIEYFKDTEINIVPYWETVDVDAAKELGLPRIGGCLCLDGSRMMRTMALFEPYTDMPTNRGILYYSDEKVYNFVQTANGYGMQCSMHAAGERAIDQYIYILNKVIKENGNKNLRHRIEHFSMPTKKHIEMAVELGLALSMQPFFTTVWDNKNCSDYERLFGIDRTKRMEPISDIIKAGGKICGGSDSPVTPMQPLRGIDACINNQDPERNIGLCDALKIFTINGAWANHEENERGSIKEGKYADIVVLDKDPYQNKDDIAGIKVLATYAGGRRIFG